LPTFIIVALGIDPTQTLVISQVVLSLVLPMPIIALIYFTRRRDIMGVLVNKRIVTVTATICAVVILSLNLLLLYLSFGGSLSY
jgi:manganese transport protein